MVRFLHLSPGPLDAFPPHFTDYINFLSPSKTQQEMPQKILHPCLRTVGLSRITTYLHTGRCQTNGVFNGHQFPAC